MTRPQDTGGKDREFDEEVESILAELSPRERNQLVESLVRSSELGQREVLPAIAYQEEILELAESRPHSQSAGIHQLFVLEGFVDVPQLRTAWTELQIRHDALRTTFTRLNDQWYQKVTEGASELVVRGAPVEEPTMIETVGRHRADGFDLVTGPLARAELVLGRENTHILVLSWHHSVVDGYSLGVLWDDLCRAYNGVGHAPTPFQQGEFAQRQSASRKARAKEAARTIGSRYPRAMDSSPESRSRPHDVDLGMIALRWSSEERGALENRAHEQGITLYMLFLAAYRSALEEKGLLTRDAPVWTPMSGRVLESSNRSVGMFMNLVPVFGSLETRAQDDMSITALQQGCVEALGRQDVPRNDLIDLLPELPRASTVFALQNISTGTFELAGLRRSMPIPSGFPPVAPILEFDSPVEALFPTALSIGFMEDSSLAGVFEYDRTRIGGAIATEVMACVSDLVSKAVARTFP
ncbi:condensation domain-containing protein [Saccharopolyspora cebuensis]|uniref:Condensation domain-containing protein n=1 Tax=Saccharopolyspora cebuensis TaxID=418759 RepID=A0ABV4CML8_9PSEU